MMALEPSDAEKNLRVVAYEEIGNVTGISKGALCHVARKDFYEEAKKCFAIVQTDDYSPYANVILRKGVINEKFTLT